MSALLMNRQSSALQSDQNDDIEQSAVSERISQNIMMNSSYVSNQMKKICLNNRLNPEFIQIDQNLPQNMILSQYTQQQLIRDIDGQYSFMKRQSSIGSNCQSCTICLNKITNPITIQPCNHIYCSQCLLEHIYNKIITGEVSIISCPGIICNIELNEDFIKSLIDEELFKKFKRFKRLKLYENNTNGRWCPKPDCENFVFRNSNSLTLICTCGQRFCFKCGNPNHDGKSCEETVDQAFSQAIVQYKIYNCPNCNAHIQKNEGCNHMFCTKCGYEFCWLCRMKYTSRHYNCFNPMSCPGEQHLNRDPYPFPKLLIAFRALLKILLYLLCSPILISVGILALLYLIFVGLYKCLRYNLH